LNQFQTFELSRLSIVKMNYPTMPYVLPSTFGAVDYQNRPSEKGFIPRQLQQQMNFQGYNHLSSPKPLEPSRSKILTSRIINAIQRFLDRISNFLRRHFPNFFGDEQFLTVGCLFTSMVVTLIILIISIGFGIALGFGLKYNIVKTYVFETVNSTYIVSVVDESVKG